MAIETSALVASTYNHGLIMTLNILAVANANPLGLFIFNSCLVGRYGPPAVVMLKNKQNLVINSDIQVTFFSI
ncbi:MAG TPA: hypothetical protein DEQ25_01850 [Methylophaga sp.]|jgi:hypothetical protein|uniref:Uncharacterized protein n=1 Tax=Pseudidiomarina aestuarii TaxID=624146 RepID=A0A2T4CTP3_9GAMM|nr:hypothetical protein [Methylophaga sp.]MBP25845.1 hypothetical protein [Methylophaga sp.]PTB84934.1 hypothetical protein C9940_05640 [Pseudidiomarina aestuarii]HAD31211.1 hypothetical protein [Methylophaga sp.]HCC80105.1 hypothetical protein [Methylophaga sp.]|tara:strand:+ start:3106 stop:3324 length:219 start_codon:yes stop_codon:yes gene_type:complete